MQKTTLPKRSFVYKKEIKDNEKTEKKPDSEKKEKKTVFSIKAKLPTVK